MLRIIVTGGGTGGHIIPALNIARALRETLDAEVMMIGNRGGMEEKIYQDSGFPCEMIHVQKLYRSFTLKHLMFPVRLLTSVLHARRIIQRFDPGAVVCTGGFVSGPPGIAAAWNGVPLYLQEQNAFPGLTTRKLARFARKIFVGDNGAIDYLPAHKCLYSGNPVHIPQNTGQTDPQKLGLRPNHTRLLILGGSQGSVTINNRIRELAPELLDNGIDIIWQAGCNNTDNLVQQLGPRPGLHIFGFSNRLHDLYHLADMAIARAGALTIAELETFGLPAIFIPYPHAAGDHQTHNARHQTREGHATMIPQHLLDTENLRQAIHHMKTNLDKFKASFTESEHGHAAVTIARIIGQELDSIPREV